MFAGLKTANTMAVRMTSVSFFVRVAILFGHTAAGKLVIMSP